MSKPTTHHETHDALDQMLCEELSWQTPPELTSQLLGIVQAHCAASQGLALEHPPVAKPSRWYTMLVSILTTMAVTLSLIVAWQFYGVVSAELGLNVLWMQAQQSFAAGLNWLYAQAPFLPSLVEVLDGVRAQLHWLLIAVVLWLALDGWSPRVPARQQQVSG